MSASKMQSSKAHVLTSVPSSMSRVCPSSIEVILSCEPEEEDTDADVGFQLKVSFMDKAVQRNARLAGEWGRPETTLSYFPFAPGESFKVRLLSSDIERQSAVTVKLIISLLTSLISLLSSTVKSSFLFKLLELFLIGSNRKVTYKHYFIVLFEQSPSTLPFQSWSEMK
uniref:Galectin n=1 Tax=Gasterosteus aculeatus aculeatus TaxID=481459 RepID=A0AAQ4NRR0_GASAC